MISHRNRYEAVELLQIYVLYVLFIILSKCILLQDKMDATYLSFTAAQESNTEGITVSDW